jgi:hypothetical protein
MQTKAIQTKVIRRTTKSHYGLIAEDHLKDHL